MNDPHFFHSVPPFFNAETLEKTKEAAEAIQFLMTVALTVAAVVSGAALPVIAVHALAVIKTAYDASHHLETFQERTLTIC